MSERLTQIEKRLKEVEASMKPIFAEQRKLEDEQAKISSELALIEAKKYVYSLEYNQEHFERIKLVAQQNRDHTLDEKLWKLGGSYHFGFHYGENVTLHQDDGEVYFLFDDSASFQSFVKENSLTIDTTNFEKQVKELKEDIQTLEETVTLIKKASHKTKPKRRGEND